MEITELSELCRLCLDSSSSLFPFETSLAYTKRTLPQLIKYCVDVDCNSNNDGGIAPKNICQSCLEKLQAVFDFKMKSQESDKYLKQIISHSTAQPPATTLAFESYTNDEDSLLEPLDVEEYQPSSSTHTNDIDLGKGQRHGEFKCNICLKSFRYVKPYKNHMKIHKKSKATKPPAPLSYYKRKKLEAAAAAGISLKKPLIRAILKTPQRTQQKAPDLTPDRELEKLHADYDSVCPAPYENEQKFNNSRDSSPDFGALMLSTSEYIGNEVLEEVNKDIPRSRTGRPVKRSIVDDDFTSSNQKGVKKFRNILPKKPQISVKKKSEEAVPTKRKPGPLSRTRGKTSEEHDSSEEVIIAGFSEVDISKMLKKSRSNDIGLIADESNQSMYTSNRSRSRSSSVELIDEIDIFDKR